MRSLIFTRAESSLADLTIMAFEGGTASHVGIKIGEYVIDSAMMQGGVRRHTVEDFMRGRIAVDEVQLYLPNPDAADAWINKQIGKPYDWSALLGFLAWRDWSDDERWYCSELGGGYMLAGGATFASRYKRMGVRLLHEASHHRWMGRLGAP
jgi:uncharacterized protein YycO